MKYTEPGAYELAYKAKDSCGNETIATRNVTAFATAFSGENLTMAGSYSTIGQTLAEIKGGQVATVIATGVVTIDGTDIVMETPVTATAIVQQSGMYPLTRVVSCVLYADNKPFNVSLIFRYDERTVTGAVQGSATKFIGDLAVKFS